MGERANYSPRNPAFQRSELRGWVGMRCSVEGGALGLVLCLDVLLRVVIGFLGFLSLFYKVMYTCLSVCRVISGSSVSIRLSVGTGE